MHARKSQALAVLVAHFINKVGEGLKGDIQNLKFHHH